MSDIDNTCIICGKLASPGTLYCSLDCQAKGWHRREICLKSSFLVCDSGYCDRCGWNPEVEERRKKKLEVLIK